MVYARRMEYGSGFVLCGCSIVNEVYSICATNRAFVRQPSYILGRLERMLYIRGSFWDDCLIAFVIVCLV